MFEGLNPTYCINYNWKFAGVVKFKSVGKIITAVEGPLLESGIWERHRVYKIISTRGSMRLSRMMWLCELMLPQKPITYKQGDVIQRAGRTRHQKTTGNIIGGINFNSMIGFFWCTMNSSTYINIWSILPSTQYITWTVEDDLWHGIVTRYWLFTQWRSMNRDRFWSHLGVWYMYLLWVICWGFHYESPWKKMAY